MATQGEEPVNRGGVGGEGREDAYVESVDDGINTGNDDYTYTYWDVFKYRLVTYLSNPWALLILAFLLYKIYARIKIAYIDPLFYRLEDWKEKRKQEQETAMMKKNPDQYRNKMEEMERARNRLQQEYEIRTAEWREKQAEKEEQRRQQDIEDWDNHQQGKGYKNRVGSGVDSQREALIQQARVKGKKGFKSDYNPLMGGLGGGSGFRPSRRTTGGG